MAAFVRVCRQPGHDRAHRVFSRCSPPADNWRPFHSRKLRAPFSSHLSSRCCSASSWLPFGRASLFERSVRAGAGRVLFGREDRPVPDQPSCWRCGSGCRPRSRSAPVFHGVVPVAIFTMGAVRNLNPILREDRARVMPPGLGRKRWSDRCCSGGAAGNLRRHVVDPDRHLAG